MKYWKSLKNHWKQIHTVILVSVLVFAAAVAAGVSVSAASDPVPDNVYFIRDAGTVGYGTGDGKSYDNPLAPLTSSDTGVNYAQYDTVNQVNTSLHRAWQKILAAYETDPTNNAFTIVICGPYTISTENCYMESHWSGADFNYVREEDGVYSSIINSRITITYTSVYGGTDYRQTKDACIKLRENSHLSFPTATNTEHLTFKSADRRTGALRALISASACPMILGSDTAFKNANNEHYPNGFCIFGGSRSNSYENNGSTNLTIDIGNNNQIGDIYGLSNGDEMHTGENGDKVSSNITIHSGTVVGNIIGDGAIFNRVGINGNVNITITDGIIKGYIYGVNEGFFNNDGQVKIKVTGGDFWYCKGIHPTDGALSPGDPTLYGTLNPSYAEVNLSDYVGDAYPVTSRIAESFTVIMPSSTTITTNNRKAVAQYMQKMADVRWTTNTVIDYSAQEGGNANLIFSPGTKYVGMPFNNCQAALEEFESILVDGAVPAGTNTGWETFPGNSCATSVRHAWQLISPTTTFDSSKDLNPVLNSGVLPVGNIDWTKYDSENYCTDTIFDYYTTEPEKQIIYQAYASASLGDALVRYSYVESPGILTGHTYMITSSTKYVYDTEGTYYPYFPTGFDFETKTIDPNESKFILTGQNNAIRSRIIAGDTYYSTWDYNLEMTFAQLYSGKYLPVTCRELLHGTIGVTHEMHDAPTSTDLGYGNLYGTLESNYTMLSVTLSVKDSGGNVVKSATAFPYSKTFNLVELSDKLNLASLSSGDYTFVVSYKAGFGVDASSNTYVAEHVAMEKGFAKGTDMVIYISNTAKGTGDGSSPENALGDDPSLTGAAITDTGNNLANLQKTAMYKAWHKIINSGKSKATIVICDQYTVTPAMGISLSTWGNSDLKYNLAVANSNNITITYTSAYGGVDYRKINNAKIILVNGNGGTSSFKNTNLIFPTATNTENLTFAYSGTKGTNFIGGNCCNLYLSNGTTFSDPTAFTILGGARDNANLGSTNIIVDIGDDNQIGNIYGLSINNAHTSGTANITIKSGNVIGTIRGDGPKATSGGVNITLEGGVYGANSYIYGAYTGVSGAVNVKVTGGDFSAWNNAYRLYARQSTVAAPASATLNLTAAPPVTADQIKLDANNNYFGSITAPKVIFIANEAKGTGDGSSAANAMGDIATAADYASGNSAALQNTAMYRAWQQCIAAGGGTIVVCGEYVITDSMCRMFVNSSTTWTNADLCIPSTNGNNNVLITYTSVYGGVDYRTNGSNAKIVLEEHSHLIFPTATSTENITFRSQNRAGNRPEAYVCGNCCDLYLGNGTVFENSTNIHIFGGPRSNSGSYGNTGTNVTLDIGNENSVGYIHGLSYGANDHSGDVNIDIVSGTVLGNVYGDGVQVGTTGDININVSGGAVNGTIYAVDAGFADQNGSANITVTGGDVNAIEVYDGSLYNATHYLPANTTLDLNALSNADRNTILNNTGSGFNYDGPLVIFVQDEYGTGKGDGSSFENALRPSIVNTPGYGVNAQMNATLFQAWEKIIASGQKEATIVICGDYTIGDNLCYTEESWSFADFRYNKDPLKDITIHYTSVYGGVDYRVTNNAALRLTERSQFAFPTATQTDNLTILSSGRTNKTTIVGGSCCDLYLGNGTNFQVINAAGAQNPVTMEDFYIFGGVRSNGAATRGSTNVIVDIGDTNSVGNIYGLSYGGSYHTGDSRITLKSGNVYGNIVGDGLITQQVGINGHVYITMEGGVLHGSIYGVNEGFVNADGTVNVNILGGKIVEKQSVPLQIYVTDGVDSLLYNAPVNVTNAILNIDYDNVDGLTAAIAKEKHTNNITDPDGDYGWFTYQTEGTQKKICTVTYTDTDAAKTETLDVYTLNVTLPEWTKELYTFTGWWTDNANGGEFVAPGNTFAPRKDITLYTVWDGVYYITIPDRLYVDDPNSYAAIGLLNTPARGSMNVNIETDYNFRLKLDNQSVYVPYKLFWDGGQATANGTEVDFTLSGEASKRIFGELLSDVPYAGIYQDPLTFTTTYVSGWDPQDTFPAQYLNP